MFSASKTGAGASGYPIVNSLRFQSASSQYLSRTPASASNRKTWTWSAWVKKAPIQGTATSTLSLFSCTTGNTDSTFLRFGFFQDKFYVGNWNAFFLQSTSVYRDPSAWYHVVVSTDTTQGTASNRMRVYINGTEITAWSTDQRSTYLTSSVDLGINQATQHSVGSSLPNVGEYFDGYLTEINFIDGQALTPSSFGETDATTGQWKAKSYSGSYGTNGFFLKFTNGTSTTTLGADSSGNGNNWTLNNFTRSAGTSDCWMIDVPSGNGGASGTQPSSNYAVWNNLYTNTAFGTGTYSNANLNFVVNNGGSIVNTMSVTAGKWYCEVVPTANTAGIHIGIRQVNNFTSRYNNTLYYSPSGNKTINGSDTSYGSGYTTNDVIGIALDMDAATVTFYKNNVSQGSIALSLASITEAVIAVGGGGGVTPNGFANFGQRSFAYTPPTGFKALCTANLPASTIVKGNQYMNALTYTGAGGTSNITTATFQPDLIWVKNRSNAVSHALIDSNRGAPNQIASDLNEAENSGGNAYGTYGGISAILSNGFTVTSGTDPTYKATNGSGQTYVAWYWKAGQGTNSSNTNGSITSTVSVNATAGFSIVKYTGTGANATVGHGLGVAPKIVFVKKRSGTQAWSVWQTALAGTEYLVLDTNAPKATLASMWNSTIPTSSVVSLGTDGNVNGSSATYIAYCFSEISGFSKFGSYVGNSNADGVFVYTGFRPRYVMIKNIGLADNWCIYDTARNSYNVSNSFLTAQDATAEQTGLEIDILSNGFKARTTNDNVNSSSYTYIYMAFAENPFAQANAR